MIPRDSPLVPARTVWTGTCTVRTLATIVHTGRTCAHVCTLVYNRAHMHALACICTQCAQCGHCAQCGQVCTVPTGADMRGHVCTVVHGARMGTMAVNGFAGGHGVLCIMIIKHDDAPMGRNRHRGRNPVLVIVRVAACVLESTGILGNHQLIASYMSRSALTAFAYVFFPISSSV